jgi:hypothetical protein
MQVFNWFAFVLSISHIFNTVFAQIILIILIIFSKASVGDKTECYHNL